MKTNITVASDGAKVANAAETGNSWSRSVGKVVLIVVSNPCDLKDYVIERTHE